MEFIEGISLTVSRDGNLFKLNRDEWIVDVRVPKGYKWNGASVPWWATRIVPRAYKMLEGSCVHDYLCEIAKNKEERKVADEKLITVMRNKGFNAFRCTVGYYGVRIGAFFGVGVHYPHWTDDIKKGLKIL